MGVLFSSSFPTLVHSSRNLLCGDSAIPSNHSSTKPWSRCRDCTATRNHTTTVPPTTFGESDAEQSDSERWGQFGFTCAKPCHFEPSVCMLNQRWCYGPGCYKQVSQKGKALTWFDLGYSALLTLIQQYVTTMYYRPVVTWTISVLMTSSNSLVFCRDFFFIITLVRGPFYLFPFCALHSLALFFSQIFFYKNPLDSLLN